MKRILLTFSFFIVLISATSQNWQLVNSGKEHWFIRSNYFKVIVTDSVKLVNNDSVYYMPVSYGLKPKYPGNFFNQNDFIVNMKYPWWVGYKVILKPDGRQYFFSAEKDTILFLPNKLLNDSWVMTRFTSGNYVLATIKNIGIDSVISSLDSVKTIELQVFDKSNIPLSTHEINKKEIIISKNNGFVKVFPLLAVLDSPYRWPYNPIQRFYRTTYSPDDYQLSNKGKRLTQRDVFGYNKGDSFQLEKLYHGVRTFTFIKEKTDFGDHINYRIGKLVDLAYNGYDIKSMSEEYYTLNNCNSLFTTFYPDQYTSEASFPTLKAYQYSLNNCGLITITKYGLFFGGTGDTLSYNTFETVSSHESYTEHSGLTELYQSWPNGDPWDNFHYLQTFAKNNYCNSGTNPIPPAILPKDSDYALTIKPNPVRNSFLLTCNATITSIRIYNSLGQEVEMRQTNSDTKSCIVFTENYSPGIYFIYLNDSKTLKFIKVK